MMNGLEKSDPCEVARKPANKPGQPGAKAGGRGEHGRAAHVPDTVPGERATGAGPCTASSNTRFAVNHPRWEPSARIAPARICAGGAG